MRRALRTLTATTLLVVLLGFATWTWSGPRADVPDPTRASDPEQVVRAYVEAVNARDFRTANKVDARDGTDLARFSRPGRMDHPSRFSVSMEGTSAHVVFLADFRGGDASIPDGRQQWGYVLERGGGGVWRIVDAGVA